MSSPPICVAVVSWNTRELLRGCLRSLEVESRHGEACVWVVDNASTDGSAEMVAGEFPWVSLVASRENLGFGPAVNVVAARTSSPWIAIANADTELLPGALRELVVAAESHPRAGIVAPRLVLGNGATQHSVYAFPTLPFTLAFNLGLPALSRGLADRMLLEGRWRGEREQLVDWAIGAFLLVRREAWDAAGGFDPAQWMYGEDLDLGWRVAEAGWETWYAPSAVVHHAAAAATGQVWGEDRDARWQRSTYAWMLRRRGRAITRAYGTINVLGAGARAMGYAPAAWLGWRGSRARRDACRRWTRLHAANLFASSAALREHR